MTTHREVGKIGFTGSIPAARHIMANAAQSIKGVQLDSKTGAPRCARSTAMCSSRAGSMQSCRR
ncbi:MAG: aldehyde dehydrogenase family protein [Chthoniobacteraceae bacterium]